MPLVKLREAYKAWGDVVDHYLREPTTEEITKLMPVDHALPLELMTVGDYLNFKANLWQATQKRNIIGLIRKEVAFARRNEHHQIAGLFAKGEYEALSDETKAKIKARFDELNEAVKGKF